MAVNPDDIKGRAKIAAGAVTDDKDLEREGRLDRGTDQAEEQFDKVGDKAEDALDAEQAGTPDLVDKGKMPSTPWSTRPRAAPTRPSVAWSLGPLAGAPSRRVTPRCTTDTPFDLSGDPPKGSAPWRAM